MVLGLNEAGSVGSLNGLLVGGLIDVVNGFPCNGLADLEGLLLESGGSSGEVRLVNSGLTDGERRSLVLRLSDFDLGLLIGGSFRLVTNSTDFGLTDFVGRSLVSWLMNVEFRLGISGGLGTERTTTDLGLLEVVSEFARAGLSRASGLVNIETRGLISRLTRSNWCSVSELGSSVAGLSRAFRSLDTSGTGRLVDSRVVRTFAPLGLNGGGSGQANESKSSDGLHWFDEIF